MQKDTQTLVDEVDEQDVEDVQDVETMESGDNQAQNEEQTQAIEQLTAKIATIDESIEQYRVNAVEARKVSAMRKYGYDDNQIEKYAKYINGDTVDEINSAILSLSSDITPAIYYGDPNINNGRAANPKTNTAEDLGKTMYQRIKHKIWR